jgi:hypothetical protein
MVSREKHHVQRPAHGMRVFSLGLAISGLLWGCIVCTSGGCSSEPQKITIPNPEDVPQPSGEPGYTPSLDELPRVKIN